MNVGHMVRDDDIPPFEGEPDTVLDENGMVRRFGLDPRRRKVDKAGHYSSCRWILVERKAKNVRDAIEQLRVTYEQIDRRRFPVARLVVVYDRIGESRLFHVRTVRSRGRPVRRILYQKIRKGGPVAVGGIEVEAYKPDEVKDMYRQTRLGTAGS